LVHGVSQLVERYFPRPVVGAPPDADRAKAFGDELESLHTFHWMALEHDTDGASRDVDDLFGLGNQRAKTYIKAWQDYRLVFNGWLAPLKHGGGSLQPHYVDSPVSAEGFAELKQRAKQAVSNLQVRCMPVRPQKGKWTKTMKSLLWLQMAGVMRCLELLVPLAFDKMIYKIDRNPAQFASPQEAYNTEVAYSKVEGSTLRSFNNGLKKPGQHDMVTLLTIIVEPLYFLTRYFLRASSVPRRRKLQQNGESPVLCDLVEPKFSPVALVLEYFSMLLKGTAPRWLLLFGRNYADFDEWALREVKLLQALRRGVTVASSWARERSFHKFSKLPWLLAVIPDARQTDARKIEVLSLLDRAPPEQVDELFSGRLRGLLNSLGVDSSVLRSRLWLRALDIWTWLVGSSVAQVEFLHGRNRRRANAGESWGHFVAKFFLDESRRQLASLLKTIKDETKKKQLSIAKRRIRQPSARALLSKDFSRALKEAGQNMRINDP
jgi:hypothetical protein